MSTLVVLIGGAHDGREFQFPDDDPVITSGTMNLPEFDRPPDDPIADLAEATFTLLRYRWDGTTRDDGARRFRLDSPPA